MRYKRTAALTAILCAICCSGCSQILTPPEEPPLISTETTVSTTETTAAETTLPETLPPPSEDDPTQEKIWSQGYEEGYAAGLIDGESQERIASDAASEEAYKEGYNDGYDAAKEELSGTTAELQEVKISGKFSATVRKLTPDYTYDETTIRAVLLQGFQMTPTFITTEPDTLKSLKEGEIYTFVLKEQTAYFDPTELWDDGSFSIDALAGKHIEFETVRAPQDGEVGLDTDRLHYEKT